MLSADNGSYDSKSKDELNLEQNMVVLFKCTLPLTEVASILINNERSEYIQTHDMTLFSLIFVCSLKCQWCLTNEIYINSSKREVILTGCDHPICFLLLDISLAQIE